MVRRRVEAEFDAEPCRVIVKRRITDDGEEVVRRIRVCDEGETVVRRRDSWRDSGPGFGRDFSSRGVPLPPRNVGPDLDEDEEG
jgi:hypothetical protein